MIIKIILIVAIIVIAINSIKSRNSSKTRAYKKLALILLVPFSIYAVLYPDTLTRLANLVGVGRGADLLLYCLAVVIFFTAFNNYVKDRENDKKIVILARKIAIIESRNDAHNKKIIK